jgi:hypothetical protein
MLLQAFYILLYFSFLTQSGFSGTVKSKSGQPIVGAFVYSYPVKVKGPRDLEPYKYTNKNGFFRFKSSGKMLFILADGFRPFVKIIPEDSLYMNIVLEESKDSERVIDSCSENKTESYSIKNRLSASIIESLHAEKVSGTNSSSSLIKYQFNNKYYHLYQGRVLSSGIPPESLVTISSRIETRTLRYLNITGVEITGITNDGDFWRYVSLGFDEWTYSHAPKQVAEVFDKIIETACIAK